jgi:hypothetical protein
LVKKESKRGRPKTTLQELKLKSETVSENDTAKKKIANNNYASKKYRNKKTNDRKLLDIELTAELEKFEKLKSTHDRLKKEIWQLKLLQFSNNA